MEFIFSAVSQIIEVPPDTAFAYFLCMLAGVLVNWIWQCKKEKIYIWDYWTKYPGNTWLSILGGIGAFVTTIILEPGLGKQTYFAMGIACDAMLNKAPLPPSVQATVDSMVVQLDKNGENAEQTK